MKLKLIEATNGPLNWGKFAVGRPDADEWNQPSIIDGYRSLIAGRGWTRDHIWVLDLQTGEGAYFRPGGSASHDLNKHRIWVCPLYEPFLTWLYTQNLDDLDTLPKHIDLPDAPFSMSGHRRPGPEQATQHSTEDNLRARVAEAIARGTAHRDGHADHAYYLGLAAMALTAVDPFDTETASLGRMLDVTGPLIEVIEQGGTKAEGR